MLRSTTGGTPVFAVQRTLQALELLADADSGVSVGHLTESLGVDKSIASRILSTLHAAGYVVRAQDSERYELSLKLIALAMGVSDRLGFPGVCQPILRRVSEDTGELAQLAAVERERLVFIANAQGQQRIAIVPTIGREVALHATASGKAWLATLPVEKAVKLALADGLDQITPHTTTRTEALLEDLDRVRRQGYATVEGEFTEGVNGVAIAIGQQRFGHAVGTIVLSAPASRLARDRLVELVPIVKTASNELEAVWPLDVARLAIASPVESRRLPTSRRMARAHG